MEMTVGNTAKGAAAGGMGLVLCKWLVACYVAGHLIPMDETLQDLLYVSLAPGVHATLLALRAAFRAWFKRKTGIDIPDSPDVAPPQTAPANQS